MKLSFYVYFYRHPPLFKADQGIIIAGIGTMGFKGGVMNPGGIRYNDRVLILAKAQEGHWCETLLEKNVHRNFMNGPPIMFILNDDLELQTMETVSRGEGFPQNSSIQTEDFRLFKFKDNIYVNHSVCEILPEGGYQKCKPGLSFFDGEKKMIRYIGNPNLDFPINELEKNWVYFEHASELYLVYSYSPYILLKREYGSLLKFKTVIKKEMNRYWHHAGLFSGVMISCSTNPISYDERHLLAVIHQRYNSSRIGSIFFQWAVLIDRDSLMPVKISFRPLFRGGECRGALPGVVYVMSTLLLGEDVVFFNGEGDSCLSYLKVKKSILNKLFIDLKVRR